MNARLPAPAGLVLGMSNADYHRHPSLSKSQLADFAVCPANYHGLHLAPNRPKREETASQRAGTLLHTLVLEPETFDERYRVGPQVATRANKEWKLFEASLPRGITGLKPEEYEEGKIQADSLRAHPEVAALLESGFPESSIFWTDPATGIECRCRPDWLHETPDGWIVLDLKTGPAAPRLFGPQCARMSYHGQAAMYSEGIEIATQKPVLAFLFGVVETDQPYLSSCVMLDEDSIAAGRRWVRDGLDLFSQCKATNSWPGFVGVQIARLPSYAMQET